MNQDYQTQFHAIEEKIAAQKAEMSAKLETLKSETVPQDLLDAVETAKQVAAEPMPEDVSKALAEAKEALQKAARGNDWAAIALASAAVTKADKARATFESGHGTGKATKAVADWEQTHAKAIRNVETAIANIDQTIEGEKRSFASPLIIESIRGGRYDDALGLAKMVGATAVSLNIIGKGEGPAEAFISYAGVARLRSSTPKAERDPNAPAPERTTGWSLNGGEIVSKAVAFDACATPEEVAHAAELKAIDAASNYGTRETNYKTTVVERHGYVKV